MTDREALLALAAPEPDYFDEQAAWQPWHDRMIEARAHAREVADEEAAAETACPWPTAR